VRVFDGHLCITQRFLYGARPYAQVIDFADALATEAKRLGSARGHAFGTTLRGEAERLAGELTAARLSLQRLAEVALHEGRRDEARVLIDEALGLARQTDIGFSHFAAAVARFRGAGHPVDAARCERLAIQASAGRLGSIAA
jgi:hypothetical protein